MGEKSAGQPATDDQSAGESSQQGHPQESDNTLSATTDQPVTDDLLHAAHVLPDLPPDMIANVEQTLDHLSATVDLFDVPPFDYGDDIG